MVRSGQGHPMLAFSEPTDSPVADQRPLRGRRPPGLCLIQGTEIAWPPIKSVKAAGDVSRHRADQDLGIKTHWEGVIDLANPTSAIIWTRVQDPSANAGGPATQSSFAQPYSAPRMKAPDGLHPERSMHRLLMWKRRWRDQNVGRMALRGLTTVSDSRVQVCSPSTSSSIRTASIP